MKLFKKLPCNVHHPEPDNNVGSGSIADPDDVLDAEMVEDSDQIFAHHLEQSMLLTSISLEK